MNEELTSKKRVAEALLLQGDLYIHLNAAAAGVDVPENLAVDDRLVLQVGLDMPVPIPDLRVDEHGVAGTLSFNRQPHACYVPWDAVFALSDSEGRGMVWDEAIAAEAKRAVEETERESVMAKPTTVAKGRSKRELPPYLRVVK